LKAGPLFKNAFRRPSVPPNMTDETDVYFDVKIERVQSKEEYDKETEIKNMEQEKEELAKLEEYLVKNNIKVEPTASGIYYLETKKGRGKAPVKDDYVTIHFEVSLLDGIEVFSTRDRGEAMDFKYGSQFENEGFQEVLGMMREGGTANAIIPSSMGFGPRGAGGVVPPFATLYYDVELIKVMTEEEFEQKRLEREAKLKADAADKEKNEQIEIQKYLTDNNLTPTETLPDGLIYVETQAGDGPKAEAGKKVKVHYTGTLLDGTKFDSSRDRGEPFEFTLGRGEVIQGWDSGIALMNVGAKGILVIPYKLGYGERGAGGSIPPYSTLVFDVELMEVAD
jgi:peptidylprolyl isomerase